MTTSLLLSENCRRETVTFASQGLTLEAYLYRPVHTEGKLPAVVTAPGFGGVKEMLIEAYAIPLADVGMACLSLDYRYFGGSSGMPRQHLEPLLQVEDIQAGLDYLQTRSDIDPTRLGVWGTSMSGGHAVSIAATDARIKAAVAIIPFLKSGKPSGDMSAILRAVVKDGLGRLIGKTPRTIPIFAENPGEFAVMASDGGWDWMQNMIADAPNYKNEVTLKSLLKVNKYRPQKLASKLSVPTLFIAAKTDSITPAEPIEAFANKVTCVKEYLEYPESHFEVFDIHLKETAQKTATWFQSHL